jgi:hypothetical protein
MAMAHQASDPVTLTTSKATSRIMLATAHQATDHMAF